MLRIFAIFSIILLTIFSQLAVADSVHEYRLQNGLMLLVKPDKRAPVVVSEVWYKVGSSYESNGTTGISHVLEHMMFRGSQHFKGGEFSQIIAKNGGQQNAFTRYDYTGYYQILAADKLAISFQLEADRMRGLLLLPQDFSKEMQIVMEERRMRTEDNPQALAYERFMATANVASEYHHPVIGWQNDLEQMTINDVRAWYKKWYGPNNAIVVVVGDVDPAVVYRLAQTYFRNVKPIQLPTIKQNREINPLGEKDIVVKVPAQLPFIIMGYTVPVVKTAQLAWQPYALAVLAGILSNGDSSRLPQNIVRDQQIAAQAGAFYDPFSRLANLFTLQAIPAQGRTIPQLKSALLAQITLLQNQLVTPAELARVKAQLIAAKVYGKDTIINQANELGSLAAVGLPWQLGDDFIKHVSSITPEQVQAVAREYLIPDHLTVMVLQPLPLSKKVIAPATPILENSHVR